MSGKVYHVILILFHQIRVHAKNRVLQIIIQFIKVLEFLYRFIIKPNASPLLIQKLTPLFSAYFQGPSGKLKYQIHSSSRLWQLQI